MNFNEVTAYTHQSSVVVTLIQNQFREFISDFRDMFLQYVLEQSGRNTITSDFLTWKREREFTWNKKHDESIAKIKEQFRSVSREVQLQEMLDAEDQCLEEEMLEEHGKVNYRGLRLKIDFQNYTRDRWLEYLCLSKGIEKSSIDLEADDYRCLTHNLSSYGKSGRDNLEKYVELVQTHIEDRRHQILKSAVGDVPDYYFLHEEKLKNISQKDREILIANLFFSIMASLQMFYKTGLKIVDEQLSITNKTFDESDIARERVKARTFSDFNLEKLKFSKLLLVSPRAADCEVIDIVNSQAMAFFDEKCSPIAETKKWVSNLIILMRISIAVDFPQKVERKWAFFGKKQVEEDPHLVRQNKYIEVFKNAVDILQAVYELGKPPRPRSSRPGFFSRR